MLVDKSGRPIGDAAAKESDRMAREFQSVQQDRLEMFAAAFVKEVGSHKASDYQLVQMPQGHPLEVRWWFEKKPVVPWDQTEAKRLVAVMQERIEELQDALKLVLDDEADEQDRELARGVLRGDA